ncbi:MAG: SPASM domain-containing protein [Selenomonadaceae bacterium]|nr:SPASM domain-containing protein [Selenomonadaceae bacterium]
MIRDIVDAGLDKIQISIYGLSDEDYKKFCGANVSFERIKENIALLYQVGHSNGKHVDMYIKIAAEYFSEEEQQSFIEQFSPITDSIFIEHVTNIWPGLKIDGVSDNGQYDLGVHDYICPTPFYMLNIHSDGVVSPCCVEWQKKLVLGDVKTQSLLDIWNDDELYNLRIATLKRELDSYSMCKHCEFPSASLSINLTDHISKLLNIYERKSAD